MKKGYWFILSVALVSLSGCVEKFEQPTVTRQGKQIYEDWCELPSSMTRAAEGIRLINKALTESTAEQAQRLSLQYNIMTDNYSHSISEPGAEWKIGLYGYYIEYPKEWSDCRLTCVEKNKYEWKLLPQSDNRMELTVEVVIDSVDRAKPVQYYKVNGKGLQIKSKGGAPYTFDYTLTDVEVMRQSSLSFISGRIDLAVMNDFYTDTLTVTVQFINRSCYDLTYKGETDRYSLGYYYYD